MELLFAYGAGLLTLINPCVLPVLPIVLAAALSEDRRGPLALVAGMSLSFVTFGLVVSSIGRAIGLTEDVLTSTGAVLMIVFGLVLMVPVLGQRFELAFAGVSSGAEQHLRGHETSGLGGQFLGGVLLGAVWSPCIGPTLGGAIALASQGESLLWAGLIMTTFALGVSTFILALSYGAREGLRARADALQGIAKRSKPLMGLLFASVGVMIFFRFHHVLEAWAVDALPVWFQDLSIML